MQPVSAHGFVDPTFALLELENHGSHAQQQGAQNDIDAAYAKLTRLRAELHRARQRAKKAANKSGFWRKCSGVFKGDIANIAGLVAATAAIAASGGTAAAVVVVVSAVASRVAKEAGAPELVCAGLGVAGAVAGVCTGNPSSLVQIARLAQSSAITLGSTAEYVSERFRADSLDAHADAKQIDIRRQHEDDRVEDNLDRLGHITTASNRSRALILDIQTARAESQTEILSRIGGA